MSWYSTGTVQVTNGSTAVVGTGTGWFGALQFGWGFVGPDGRNYEITAVASDTALTLATPYQGATAGAQSYSAFPTAGTDVGLVQSIQALIAGFQAVKDGPGQGKFTGNVVLVSDPDTGLTWLSSNEIGLLAGNAVQLALKAGGATGAAVQADPADTTTGKLVTTDGARAAASSHHGGYYPGGSGVNIDTAVAGFVGLVSDTNAGTWPVASSGGFVWIDTQKMYSGQAVLQAAVYGYSGSVGTTPRIFHRLRSNNGAEWGGWFEVLASADGTLGLNSGINPTAASASGAAKGTLQLSASGGAVGDGELSSAVSFSGTNTNRRRAMIAAFQDGADGDPTGLKFFTYGGTSTGTDLVAERMVLSAGGNLGIGGGAAYKLGITEDLDATLVRLTSNHASFAERLILGSAARAASTAYDFFRFYSSGLTDMEARLTGTGNLLLDGAVTGGGADYAEYFEWQDGNPAGEDRRGVAVVLEGDQIRPALAGEHPIGVISATPSVIGDGDMDRWKGKYLRDAFGAYLWEGYEVVEWTEVVTEMIPAPEEGGDPQTVTRDVPHSYAVDALPEGVQVPPDATRSIQQRRVLNPVYDPDLPYVSRSERPEWALVGLLGKLRIRSGQPTAPGWIKMRDVSAEVAEWLVK